MHRLLQPSTSKWSRRYEVWPPFLCDLSLERFAVGTIYILTVARRESLLGQLDPKSSESNVTPQPWSDTLEGGTNRKKLASTSKPPPSAKEKKKPPGVPLHPRDKPSLVGDIKTDPFLAITKYPRGESRTMEAKDSTGKFVDRVQALVLHSGYTDSLTAPYNNNSKCQLRVACSCC
jgi:hypothetical protein